jgi:hypothetical protein
MRKMMLIYTVLTVCALAAPVLQAPSHPVSVEPQPAYRSQFYWDDGEMYSAWAWYSGGNYWAVDFDEEKTEGIEQGIVEAIGAMTYPDWPSSVYEGAYMHVFDDDGGYPGESLFHELLVFTDGGVFEWLTMEQHVYGSVFYIAFEQYGDYPDCDAMAVDAAAGSHNWTGYQGSWDNTALFGDFMLRCYWQPFSEVTETTWGRVKALY